MKSRKYLFTRTSWLTIVLLRFPILELSDHKLELLVSLSSVKHSFSLILFLSLEELVTNFHEFVISIIMSKTRKPQYHDR